LAAGTVDLRATSLPKINHIGIDVRNMDRAFNFLSRLFGVELPNELTKMLVIDRQVRPSLKGDTPKRFSFIPTGGLGGTIVELNEARLGSWEHELLVGLNGEMAVGEIGFEVDDIEKCYDSAREMGLIPCDADGEPLAGKKYDVSREGELEWKYFFLNLPIKPYKGPLIEIMQFRNPSDAMQLWHG
jgi:catechol 2,3-dioxygenase-like lactoylglutathione lyase family enzyme